jgi:hypothetical protein
VCAEVSSRETAASFQKIPSGKGTKYFIRNFIHAIFRLQFMKQELEDGFHDFITSNNYKPEQSTTPSSENDSTLDVPEKASDANSICVSCLGILQDDLCSESFLDKA